MKKKWVFLRINRAAENPEEQQALIHAENDEFHIMTVRGPEEAIAKAAQLKDEGFGVIECCGAFDDDLCRKMFEATGCTVPCTHIVVPDEMQELVQKFWLS